MTTTKRDRLSLLRDPRGCHAVVIGGGKTGAASARLLLARGARVSVLDDAPRDRVIEGLRKHGLAEDSVTIIADGIDGAVVAAADLVLLSPGVPRAHPALQLALAAGVPFCNEVELGVHTLGVDGVQVWAITGTNGKSTTTTMAGAIAQQRDPHAFVGGNLGAPLCGAVVDGLQAGTREAPRILVLELSSYQLESIEQLPVFAATCTNLTPDHLDRYPSVDAYFAAKARLFSLVVQGGGVSLNAADPESRRCLDAAVPGGRTLCHFDVSTGVYGVEVGASLEVVMPGARGTIALHNPRIVGRHNAQNAAAATALATIAGLRFDEIQRGLDAYSGIAHRLERVGDAHGVTWWNDSKATNVDAAVTALRSFTRGVHLIAGGLGKGAPYAPLVDAARSCVVAVYTIGKDAPALEEAFASARDAIAIVPCGSLEQACAAASARAVAGEHIVLSPACASFDQFRDYGHRGERFRALFAAQTSSNTPTASSAHDAGRPSPNNVNSNSPGSGGAV